MYQSFCPKTDFKLIIFGLFFSDNSVRCDTCIRHLNWRIEMSPDYYYYYFYSVIIMAASPARVGGVQSRWRRVAASNFLSHWPSPASRLSGLAGSRSLPQFMIAHKDRKLNWLNIFKLTRFSLTKCLRTGLSVSFYEWLLADQYTHCWLIGRSTDTTSSLILVR